MVQEERSIFWEKIVSDIAEEKGFYDHVSVTLNGY